MAPTKKSGGMLSTADLTEWKKLKNTDEKSKRENNFQRDYRKYASDPAKYDEFKRRDCERKTAKKASELATYAKKYYLHLHRLPLNIMQQKLGV